ncbi:RNA-directed DNA polymerase [Sphingobacterium sp. MYb388]|uniref:RNA-directed DNA polymerase n=1 Tax=Sphingobacterium sp. MYb388 TaxID=2745437 RepID=UPI0030B17CB7
MNILREDIISAYKQLKSFLYHENLQICATKIVDFESDFENNIATVLDYLNSSTSPEWGKKDTYFTIIKNYDAANGGLVFTDVKQRWNSVKNNIKNVNFRIISDLSIETHLVSIIWINKVAKQYEIRLSSSCYGTRLQKQDDNNLGTKLFTNYLHDYKNWQVSGIESIKNEFKNGKGVIAVTADIKAFYHNVDYKVINDHEFYKNLSSDIEFTSDMQDISDKVFFLIDRWSQNVYSELSNKSKSTYYLEHVGLPIGLPLSKVLANLILKEFDDKIHDELSPVYYGRYVDDLFLVIKSNPKINSRNIFWEHLKSRLDLEISGDCANVGLNLKNAGKSDFNFNIDKEKFFYLDSKYGKNLVKDIEEELNKNSSEWRFVPENGEALERLSEEILTASTNSTEPTNSLRKSDGISVRRLKFAHYISTVESYAVDHPYNFWKEAIKKLTEIVNSIIIDPFTISDYIQYLPRFLRLLVFSKNEYLLKSVENSLIWTCTELKTLKSDEDNDGVSQQAIKMADYINQIISEAKLTGTNFFKDYVSKGFAGESLSYFLSDLHFLPLNSIFTNYGFLLERFLNESKTESSKYECGDYSHLKSALDFKFAQIIKSKDFLLTKANEKVSNFGFFFYTRPLSIFGISQAVENFVIHKPFFECLCKLYDRVVVYPDIKSINNGHEINILNINKDNPKVALSSYLLNYDSWLKSVRKLPEPDGTRWNRLYNLMNEILKSKTKSDIVVFPELCLSEFSVSQIHRMIRQSSIIFIGGIDYKYDRTNKTAINRMVYLLPVKEGRTIYHLQLIQEKAIGAIHEMADLERIEGLRLICTNPDKYIIRYSGFSFSSLICNEFLNIDYRTKLRGEVDALFLLEWNQDLVYYNSLVEATSNDLHTFIVQVNNLCYGDTRLRGPYKEDYERDVARVRGGEVDYFVIAKLETQALREFQNYHISPTKVGSKFKPVPTGFEISYARKLTK